MASYILQVLLFSLNSIASANFDFPIFNGVSLGECITNGSVSSTESQVDLTKNDYSGVKDSSGNVYYKRSFRFKNSATFASFSTSFSFNITPIDGIIPGDGMTFFIQAKPLYPSAGMNLGVSGTADNPFFAVEFDDCTTSSYDDPSCYHVGIDFNTWNSFVTACYDFTVGKQWAWIDYDGQSQLLELRVANKMKRPSIAQLSKLVDLFKFFNTKDDLYVGLSAAAGIGGGQLHTVFSWSFNFITPSKRNVSTLFVILGSIFGVVIFACIVIFACFIFAKRSRAKKKPIPESQLIPESQFLEISLPRFSYADLSIATKKFSDSEILGQGGFGSVYKGVLPSDRSTVAVKVMSAKGYHQFVAELSVIGRLKHKNLVGLRGWCYDHNKLMLVYDYMPNGSLDQHLFSAEKLLSWPQRYEIVKGVAEGLAFLHEGWEQRIVHRDIKAPNVLLDHNVVAHLGDFGLSKLMEENKAQQTMTQAGTMGYIAPELAYMGRASEKSDIYSFGILLLEIACGKSVFGMTYENQVYELLLDWVWQAQLKDELVGVADPRLHSDYDKEEMRVLLSLGLLCSHPDADFRPSMRRCCQILNFESNLPDLPYSKPTMVFNNFQSYSSMTSSVFSQSTRSIGQSSGFLKNSNSERYNLSLLDRAL